MVLAPTVSTSGCVALGLLLQLAVLAQFVWMFVLVSCIKIFTEVSKNSFLYTILSQLYMYICAVYYGRYFFTGDGIVDESDGTY